MSTPPIALRDVGFGYASTPVLQSVNLTLAEGDFLGIIGPNAGGKTTLLKIILGLLEPDQGTVEVFGRPPAASRGSIGYVPQYAKFDAGFPIDVLETVRMGCLGPSVRALGQAGQRDLAMAAIERVELTDLKSERLDRLSGGQLQRVLIARALVSEPRILLLDEPTASVDTRIGRSVYELLGLLSGSMTIILVSHDIGVISRYVKTIACLNVRLHYHHSRELTDEMVEAAYGCPVDLVAHGHPHRVLPTHSGEGG